MPRLSDPAAHSGLKKPSYASPALNRPPSVMLMDDHDQAYHLWKADGIQHQILLHFDAHIDFEWIAERDPSEVLRKNSAEHALNQFKNPNGWVFGDFKNRFMHLGNYLHQALSEGMIKAWYWIVPDSLWNNSRVRKQIWQDLLDYYQYRTGPMTFPQKKGNFFTCYFLDVPTIITSFSNFPDIAEPVILNIDVDFLTTRPLDRIPRAEKLRRILPWLWPDEFSDWLSEKKIEPLMITIANSVRGGFTPLCYKFFGQTLVNLLKTSMAGSNYPLLKKALILRSKGQNEGALSILNSFNTEGVFEATRLFLSAELLYENRRIHEARQCLSEACYIDPEFSSSYNNYAAFYESRGHLNSAYQEYQMMKQILPDQIEARLGEACCKAGSHPDKRPLAILTCRQILAEHPNHAETLRRLGSFLLQDKRWEEAASCFLRLASEAPYDLQARIGAGKAFLGQKDWEKAKNYLREALGLGAHFPSVYFLLAKVYFQLGYRAKARELWFEGSRLRIKKFFHGFKRS